MKRGEMYESRHWLNPRFMPLHIKACMLITRVTKSAIYFRPHYGFHDPDERGAVWPWLGSSMWTPNTPEGIARSFGPRMEIDKDTGAFRTL